ncbi:ATP-binding protein [Streptomyces sp. NPDC058466]|uniref:ATP-binding protein n=1 Tax=Streptomyces sp. NPDC058466 TaxID=3346512 RepID=UPI00364F7A9F
MKITPSARVLRMLGEIEFKEWQCVAELVDNSFDDFTEIIRSGVNWPNGYKVSVSLPDSSTPRAQLVIRDTGRGMAYEQLERAVRAGWSSNDMHDKLGLFGMGFNVSTARLGKRTRVLTTRPGDTEWIGVEIDLDKIGDDFEADDITEPKDDPSEHGTKIIVDRLHRTRGDWLRRNGAALRNQLGAVYSWLLIERGFELYVGRTRVKPVRHCRWGEDRYVEHGTAKERIPAYIAIDEKLEDGLACLDCGQWQLTMTDICSDCGGDRLSERQRRIHGWLGIQRHLDKTEYGLDFLRNGRKILRWDKQLFTWRNPNGVAGNEEPEYPVELAHQGGRIIGEIHLDHVPVTYQKDAFEYGDRSWRSAVEVIRGVAPLQPKRAENAGFPENTSPLATLFKGFRRNDAGLRCLVPGDGRKPIHEETRRWAADFHKGSPDYQTDERWWQAVQDHEAIKQRGKETKTTASVPSQPDVDAVLDALGVPGDAPSSGEIATNAAPDGQKDATSATPTAKENKETRGERIARYERLSNPHPRLSRPFGHPSLGYLQVETRLLDGEEGLRDDSGQPVPVLLDQRAGNDMTALIDPEHGVFRLFGSDYADLLLVELAAVLKVRARSEWSPSRLVAAIRSESLKDGVLDGTTVGAEARELLVEVRARMARELDRTGAAGKAFTHLTRDEITATENQMIASGKVGQVRDLGQEGGFLEHVPPLALVRLVETMPATFLDGHVFRGPYANVASDSARALSLARVTGYLSDVATHGTYAAGATAYQLQRARLSAALLVDELAGDE